MADPEPSPDPSAPAAVAEFENHGEGNPVSPAGTSPPVSSINSARRQLLAALQTTDGTVDRLDRLMATAAGQERVLAVTGYLAHTLHHILSSAPWIAFQTRLSLLARLRNHSKSPSPKPTSSSASQKPRLLALSSLMSETRFTLRLLGLVPLWTWGSHTIKSPPADRILYILTLLQVFVNVIYQALENVGYLASKGIVSKRFVDRWGGIDKWYIWSTRAWFGHIFFQFFVLWRGTVLRKRKMATADSKEKQDALKAEIRSWRKSLMNNVCWAPLCLHWCFEKGIGFPEHLTGFVSFLAGAWEFCDSWAATGSS
ncbi:hypothetical protein BO94DRAFT_535128 [Aspergillus sclerotioniger CBS 115572]|uniref:25D9-5p n=1 Tax=Aspergillus sclerotioniger CBS 115572 TaxID=1450535 RepID=A0A317WL31_9EURO|nr:hypothetical protein BO94DRAFT_535128 [Aspergillus sclerotioniger CBS 115572]PWY87019.1 hypothetical protein BO94DRAFT_535128 [Aspergillus sclerotioniger CBS 115572]